MTSTIEKNTKNNSENYEQLMKQISLLSNKLDEIKILAGKEQGRWANFDNSYSPEWTIPFKKIINIIED